MMVLTFQKRKNKTEKGNTEKGESKGPPLLPSLYKSLIATTF